MSHSLTQNLRLTTIAQAVGFALSMFAAPAFSAACDASGTTVTISGATDDTCNFYRGQSLVVTQTGSISTYVYGVYVHGNGPLSGVGSITNNGLIESIGSYDGINFSGGTLSGIYNGATGTIRTSSAYGTAIVVQGTLQGSIDNYGLISAANSGYGIYFTAGSGGDINNYATIQGGNFSIWSERDLTVNNWGLLDGTVVDHAHMTLNLNGNDARVAGTMHVTTVNVNGAFTTEGDIYSSNINIASTGALKIDGSQTARTLAGAISNAGTMRIAGAGNTIGDYTQTSTGVLQIDVDSAGVFGSATATGAVDLSLGSINVNTATADQSNLVRNATHTVLSANSLTMNPLIDVTDTSLLFNFTASQVGNDLVLKTVSDSVASVGGSTSAQGNTAASGAAATLDALLLQGQSAPAGMLPVINALGALSTEKELSDAVSQTLPLMTAGISQSMMGVSRSNNQVVQSRQEANVGLSSGDGFLGDRQVWFKPLGSWAKQKDRNGVSGYGADTYGMVFGVDGTLSDKSAIGAAFAYTSTKVDSNSSVAKQSADIDGYQVAVYGNYRLDDRTAIMYQADIGNNQVDGNRLINFGGLITKADSNFSSWSGHVGVGIGKSMDLSAVTTFTPSIRADYTRLQTESYTEKGAGGLNLRVGSDSVEELVLGIDGAFNHKLSDRTSLVANIGVGYDTLAEQSSNTASFVGGGASFTTKGLDPSPWIARGGLGIVMHNGPLMQITARYDVEARDDFTNQTASVKVGYKF